jgi:hypothetical protein
MPFCWQTASRKVWRAKPSKKRFVVALFAIFAGKKSNKKEVFEGLRPPRAPLASKPAVSQVWYNSK